MKDILGNDFFISIAVLSDSPTQAAKTAQLAGCTPDQIRAIRNASKFLRDSGKDEFDKKYSPYKVVDIDIKVYKSLKARISIDKLYERRGLNGAEYNELADLIESAIAGTKFEIKIDRKEYKGHVKA